MKKYYTYPQACPVEIFAELLIAASPAVGGDGQDYDDPIVVSEDEFNLIF